MRVKLMLCFIGFAAIACTDDGELVPKPIGGEAQAVVFETGPRVAQCAPPVVTPASSAARLAAVGIEVHRSSCGVRLDGMGYPAVCGAGVSGIILHDIPAAQVEAAKAAGFGAVDDLPDWRRESCAPYIHAIEVAQATTSCVDIRNRVIQILPPSDPDSSLALLDQAGNCADASYRQVLYGGDGRKVLCSNEDSIAGPRKSCPVASYTAVFETILANLAAPDLGLAGYSVDEVFPRP